MTTTTKRRGATAGLRRSTQQVWLAGMGTIALAEEEGGKLLRTLVRRGAAYEEKTQARLRRAMKAAKETRDDAESMARTWGTMLDARVTSALRRAGLPSASELRAMIRRGVTMRATVNAEPKPSPRRASARKAHAPAAKSRTTTRPRARRATVSPSTPSAATA